MAVRNILKIVYAPATPDDANPWAVLDTIGNMMRVEKSGFTTSDEARKWARRERRETIDGSTYQFDSSGDLELYGSI
jgi:hypothetical protein